MATSVIAQRPMRPTRRTLSADEEAQISQAFAIFTDGGRKSVITYRELKHLHPGQCCKHARAELGNIVDVQACMRALGFAGKKKDVLTALHNHSVPGEQAAEVDSRDFSGIMKELFLGRDEQETVQRAFELLAAEEQASISLRSLRQAVRATGETLSDEDLLDMIEMFDTDGNGVIDRQEFARIMQDPDPFGDEDW